MFDDLDWPLNSSRGLSAIAEFLVCGKNELFHSLLFHYRLSDLNETITVITVRVQLQVVRL